MCVEGIQLMWVITVPLCTPSVPFEVLVGASRDLRSSSDPYRDGVGSLVQKTGM